MFGVFLLIFSSAWATPSIPNPDFLMYWDANHEAAQREEETRFKIADSKNQLEKAKDFHKRNTSLYAKQAISKFEFEESALRLNTLSETLEGAETELQEVLFEQQIHSLLRNREAGIQISLKELTGAYINVWKARRDKVAHWLKRIDFEIAYRQFKLDQDELLFKRQAISEEDIIAERYSVKILRADRLGLQNRHDNADRFFREAVEFAKNVDKSAS